MPAERVVALRQRAQDIAEFRVIEREPVDRDRDRALVVAETLQDRREATDIASRASGQAKRIHGAEARSAANCDVALISAVQKKT
jgi:hypothetical protein